jgi:hypothetical protein
MTFRVARLVSFTAEHEFFAGAPARFVSWTPLAGTAVVLAGLRLRFRATENGGEVWFEVDASRPGAAPAVTIPADTALHFAGQAAAPQFAGYTGLPAMKGTALHGANLVGHAADGRLWLHPGPAVDAAARVRLTGRAPQLRHPAAGPTARVEILDARAAVLVDQTVAAANGSVTLGVDLTPWAPGPFTVRVDGAETERLFADDALLREPPALLVTLHARTGVPAGLELLDAAGAPPAIPPALALRLPAAAAVWRYVVALRSDPALEADRLQIEDTGAGDGRPITFAAAGPKAPLADGTPAVVFESAAAVPCRAAPRAGLRLRTRGDAPDSWATALADLPNPPPGVLGATSTPARPVAEQFIHL